ncbi:hypothetical protein [Alteromonas mediterranea]|uniref:hypothetical protein n=1 Tax=Alteromonas mediterranea TaxID=314275 RepID=UPI0012F82579|nr:hypothetical protein [Alteromonas mediterranea]QGX61736.1 hypothetical protein FJN15_08240 [Alteromonas mediterranea]
MKKISSHKNTPSPFSRIMQKGQQKARYKERNGKFLMSMSEDDHTRIAHLIKRWLEEDSKTR